MTDLWKNLRDSGKPVLLYGMGNGADLIVKYAAEKRIRISGIFASDDFVRGQLFYGMRVMTLSEAESRFGDFTVLLAFGSNLIHVIEKIKALSKKHELYAPDVPVYGKTLFDSDYYLENADTFTKIRSRFADEKSKYIFDSIIKFKLSGKLNFLFAAESDKSDENKILSLSDNEKYYDLGAYTGDTVSSFVNSVNSYCSITAVEPDTRNFAKLVANTDNLREINCINAAAGYLDGYIKFSNSGGRDSCVGKNGASVRCVTVDSLCKVYGEPTYIKFDVEGQELNALIGSSNTIKLQRPKMLVSAYHRTEDLINIPTKVLSCRSDYKMYIRHYRYIPCWDTNYYFI